MSPLRLPPAASGGRGDRGFERGTALDEVPQRAAIARAVDGRPADDSATTRSVATSAAGSRGRLSDALMGGNEILPRLAGVDDLRRGPDLGEIAAFAKRILARLHQPYRV